MPKILIKNYIIFLIQGLGNVNGKTLRIMKISFYITFQKHIFVVKCILVTELSSKPYSGHFK